MHLQFVYPWMLYLIWLAIAIGTGWLIAFRQKEKKMDKFLSAPMQQKLCPPRLPTRFYWQLGLVWAGILMVIIAAARPQWGTREEKVFQRGRDLVIALDVSRSMLAQDVHPNRLQRAKTDILDLLRELRGDRAALIAFRGKAVQLCPLTTDYSFLEQTLDYITIDSAPRGKTNIGDAIEKAMDAFENDEASHKAIILISDGEDLSGLTEPATAKARKKSIAIFTVGLGDPKGATIPDSKKQGASMTYQGKKVITKLDHKTMKAIAENTGGAYVPVGVSNVKLGTLYRDHLRKIAARDIKESIQQRYIDRYQYFLLPAILCFLATALLSRGRLATNRPALVSAGNSGTILQSATNPQTTGTAMREPASSPLKNIGLIAFILAIGALAGTATEGTNQPPASPPETNIIQKASEPAPVIAPGQAGARTAQHLYRLGKYKESAEAYLQSRNGASEELQNDLLFNAGCALYRAGDFKAAADKFAELAKRDSEDTAAADYNLGCSVYQTAEAATGSSSNRHSAAVPLLLEQSGQAFQRALRADPENPLARVNLAVITNILPNAREQAKIQALMEKYRNAQPFQITDKMLKNQRNINKQLSQVITNTTPAKIKLLENLSTRQKTNTDLMIPLKPILATAMSRSAGAQPLQPQQKQQQQQLAQLDQHIEAVRNVMKQASEQLRDLDGNAGNSTMSAESGIYNIWKGTAPYAPLLREDIYRQTNTIAMTTSVMTQATDDFRKAIKAEQDESVELTQLFTDRFTQAVPPEGIGSAPAPSGMPDPAIKAPAGTETNLSATVTNEPVLSAETRATILELAQDAKTSQTKASELLAKADITTSLTEQKNSYRLLKEIEKLLPKDKQQQKQQQQKQQQKQDQQKQDQQKKDQQKQDQQKQDQQKKDQDQQKKDEKKEQKKDEHEPEPKPQPEPEQQPEPEKQPAAEQQEKPGEKEMTPEQAKALLEKARQREKDHEKEKMMRSFIPLSPVDKDW